MTHIRVDTSVLRQAALNIGYVADRLTALGNQLLFAAHGAPSYGGQFGPKVEGMGAEAYNRAITLVRRLRGLSEDLQAQAEAFDEAEMAAAAALREQQARFRQWMQDPANATDYPSSPADARYELQADYFARYAEPMPTNYAGWVKAAQKAGMPLDEFLLQNLAISPPEANAFSIIGFTETKEVGIEAVMYATQTVLNRKWFQRGTIAPGQYGLLEMIKVRPDLFMHVVADGETFLQYIARSQQGQALLGEITDEAFLLRTLKPGSESEPGTYNAYRAALLQNADPDHPDDPMLKWRALDESGALPFVLPPGLLEGMAAGFFTGIDMRTSPEFLAAMSEYGRVYRNAGIDSKLDIPKDILGVPGDLKTFLDQVDGPQDLKPLRDKIQQVVEDWIGTKVDPDAITFKLHWDGTGHNLEVRIDGGRSAMAAEAQRRTILLMAGYRLGDPAMFFPAEAYGQEFVDGVRKIYRYQNIFEANPTICSLDPVEVFVIDPETGKAKVVDITWYEKLLRDKSWQLAADSLVVASSPDGIAFVTHAQIGPVWSKTPCP